MKQIDYYFSVLSPFTYLAGMRLEEIASEANASINYKPVDIMGLFGATGGTPPKDRHWSRQQYRIQELTRIAEFNQLPINLKPAHWPTDPQPASFAIIAAQAAGLDVGPLCHAITAAVWAEDRQIADADTLTAVLKASGIEQNQIASGLESAAAQYEQNTKDAIEAGVFGAPFYKVDDQGFWGQDRLDYLARYLKK